MELASILAGERFSDQPRAVSPVIAAMLRVFNDRLDDDARQGLKRYAAEAVGTRAPAGIERERARRCLREAGLSASRFALLFRASAGWREAISVLEVGGKEAEARLMRLLDDLIAMSGNGPLEDETERGPATTVVPAPARARHRLASQARH
jgi:hypothetical protein